ncbi:MAG: ferritin family protein, partial [Thermodesulfobacteriota bacterium]
MTYDDYKKIISRAIGSEIEAYTFYRAVSDKVKDKNLKGLFSELAGDEEKHRLTLEGFLKQAPEKLHFSTSQDYKVVDPLPTPPLT